MHVDALLSLHGLITIAALLAYVFVTRALHQRRYPAAAIGWVTFILLLPYVALPMFLVFGTRKLARQPQPLSANATAGLRALPWPQALAQSMELAPALPYRNLAVHADGAQALAALHAVIESATRTLDVCTFIVGNDALGRDIIAALVRRAQAGVRVRFLLDGIGRWLGGGGNLSALTAAGAEVAIFVPLLHSPTRGRVNLRNHRKLVIADGERVWTGGRNLATEYFLGAPREAAWHDLTFDLEGELVASASALFAHDWAFAMAQREGAAARRGPDPGADANAGAGASASASVDASARVDAGAGAAEAIGHGASAASLPTQAPPLGQLVPTGPDQAYDTVLSMLVTACFRAQQRIVAVTPYFVPDQSLAGALTLAAQRGITVDLVLPAHSNHHLADFARHRALRDLAHAGVNVWLLPRMIHAKAFVVDQQIAFAGSVNLDSRSLFLNYEMMMAFYAGDDVERFAAWIDAQRAQCTRYVAHTPSLLRDVAEGLVLGFAFQI